MAILTVHPSHHGALMSLGLCPLLSSIAFAGEDVEAQRHVGGALANLAASAPNRAEIVRSGGLRTLHALIQVDDTRTQRNGLAGLANLAMGNEDGGSGTGSGGASIRARIVAFGQLRAVLALAESPSAEVQRQAARLLLSLLRDRKLRGPLAAEGAPTAVAALSSSSDSSARAAAAEARQIIMEAEAESHNNHNHNNHSHHNQNHNHNHHRSGGSDTDGGSAHGPRIGATEISAISDGDRSPSQSRSASASFGRSNHDARRARHSPTPPLLALDPHVTGTNSVQSAAAAADTSAADAERCRAARAELQGVEERLAKVRSTLVFFFFFFFSL
jgi:hypothetical protein